MSMAFQVTDEDIDSILVKSGKSPADELLLIRIMDSLDHDQITKAALYMDDLDEQTTSAHEEIELQLKELGFI